ncbi:MAG TPA: 2-C-methyl-D-erythritol 4-phosphate cytidylyltransferase, partial [Tepidisphaeraceae bacterium]
VVPGGSERQDSVRAGLDALGFGCEWVIVHDAARPLITCDLVQRGLHTVRRHRAAVAAVPVRDTLKRVHEQAEGRLVRETVSRDRLWAAQTPQLFQQPVLRQAFQAAGRRAAQFTDDASLVEAMGWPVAVFEGASDNLKVTYPEDLPLVEALLRARLDGNERQ